MREVFTSRDTWVLVKSPSVRQQVARRRALVACGVLALALASGLFGALSHRPTVTFGQPHTGPFSYFPSE